MMARIQARDIIRFAKKEGIKLQRQRPNSCAFGVFLLMHNLPSYKYAEDVAEPLQIDPSHLIHLEAGFEGWQVTYDQNIHVNPANRYYKVGQNVARLAGLPPLTGSQV